MHKTLRGCATLLLLCCAARTHADQIYSYDDRDRLVRVVDESGNVTAYRYDAAGNMVQVVYASITDLPVIDSVDPDRLNQDDERDVRILGQNLLLPSLSTDNPGISISNVSSPSSDEIVATFRIAPDAPLGVTTLTVETPIGNASTDLALFGPRPRILSVLPSRGSAKGGTTITLAGLNLSADTSVEIGGTAATDVVLLGPGLMTAVTPPGPPGTAVDVASANPNGSDRLPNGYLYTFPFSLPGALPVATGSTGGLTVTLEEAVSEDTTVTLSSNDPSVAFVPAQLILGAGENVLIVPVTAGAEGTAVVTVTIDGLSLALSVQVTPAFSGDLDLLAAVVGGGFAGGPSVAAIGTAITPRPIASLLLGSGGDTTVTLQLSQPVPAGGLLATLTISDPAVGSVPADVFVPEGALSFSFQVSALAPGVALIGASVGDDTFQVQLLVDRALDVSGSAGLADPVGVLPKPVSETLAPPVGANVAPHEPTLAPAIGVEVE